MLPFNLRKVGLSLFALCLTAGLVVGQTDLQWIRDQWRSGNYQDVIGPLEMFLSSVGDDNKSFEADYLMATSLSALPNYHDMGCRYFTTMFRLYQSPYTGMVDGSTFSLQAANKQYCVQPGVDTVYALRIEKRSAILQDVAKTAPKKLPQKLATGPVARLTDSNIEQFNGIYEMVHDGWRGTLELKGGSGMYIDTNRRAYKMLVEIRGNHIVFYVLGLGGENAEGRGGQKFDGYLMTQTHDDIAGLTWWQGQPFGFYAIRRKP